MQTMKGFETTLCGGPSPYLNCCGLYGFADIADIYVQ